jgi:hypothetical protein
MRGRHDPAGVRAVGRRETRIAVLLSQRNPEPDRHNRTRALPFNGLGTSVAVRSKTRMNPERTDWAFPARPETAQAGSRSSQPDDPCVDPLYLFVCALAWRRQSNTSAGWELVRYVRSSGQAAQIASALLAPEDSLPVRDRVRVVVHPGKASLPNDAGMPGSARWRP